MPAETPFRRLRRILLQRTLRLLDTRRQRMVAWHALAAAGEKSVSCERDGLVWKVYLDDDIGFCVFVEDGYQREQVGALLEWMDRTGLLAGSRNVIVDVGANIGTTCIPIVHRTGCRALAIEPVAGNFRLLEQNVAANGLGDRILRARCAVLREPGKTKMRLTAGARGGHFVSPQHGTEEVEADTLAGILASAGIALDEVALVWADVQGCEGHVVETGAALWERGVPLWTELEPHSLELQYGVTVFAALCRRYFDRFIASRDLMRLHEQARPAPIAELESLMRGIASRQISTDVLLLPAARVARVT